MIRLKTIITSLITIFLSVLLMSCNNNANNSNVKQPIDLNGRLIIFGLPVNAERQPGYTPENTYYDYNIKNNAFTKLDINLPTIGTEGFKERLTYTICQQKRERLSYMKEKIAFDLIQICKEGEKYDNVKKQYVETRLNIKDLNNLTTPSTVYTITTDNVNKKIIIKDNILKTSKSINIDNEIICQTISPDSKYIAYFEIIPNSSNHGIKGLTYKLNFLNVLTGAIYTDPKANVILPIASEWIYP